MSQPISKNQIAEEGVLDNLLNPLNTLIGLLDKSTEGLKNMASAVDSVKYSEKAKDIRELSEAEKDLNTIYEAKKKVQRESIDAENSVVELRKELAKKSKEYVRDLEKENQLIADLNGTIGQNAKQIVKLKKEQSDVSTQMKLLEKQLQANQISSQEYTNKTAALIVKQTELKVSMGEARVNLNAQTKEQMAADGSMEQMRQRLGQMREAYRALNHDERNNLEIGGQLLLSINKLENEWKSLQETTGNFQHNVGNYEGALEKLNAKIDAGGMTMREMSKAIKDYNTLMIEAKQRGDEETFQRAAVASGQLKDQMADASAVTRALSSDTINLDAAMSLAKGVAGVGQAYQGLKALGVENDQVLQSVQKLAAIQSIFNGLKQMEATINKNNIALLKQTTVWQKLAGASQMFYAKATTGATVASRALSIAMYAIPFVAIVGLIALVVSNWERLVGWFNKGVETFNNLGEKTKLLISIMFPLIGLIRLTITALEKLGIIEGKAAEAAIKAREQQAELMKERRKQVDAAIADNKRLRDTIGKTYDFEIAMAKAAGKDVFELEQKKREELIQTYKTDIKLKMLSARLETGNLEKMFKLRQELIQTLEDIETLEKDIKIANQQRATEQAKSAAEAAKEAKKAHEERVKMFLEQEERHKKYMEELQKLHDQNLKNIGDEKKAFLDKMQAMNDVVRIHTETVEEANRRELLGIKIKYKNLKAEAIKNGVDVTEIEQAERLEREAAEKRHQNAMLKIQESELDKKQLELKKQNLETITDDKAFKEAEKQREIQHLQDLIELRKQAGEDVIELEIKLLELQKNTTEKAYAQSVENIANKVADLYAISADRAIEAMKRQQDAAAAMMNHFAGLAENGSIEATHSMAAMIERQEELQRKQEQIERRKLRIQRASQAGAILAKELESGKSVPEALASMGAFLAASEGLIPSFDVGIENTGKVKGRGIDGKGGFLAINHENERIFKSEENKLFGNVSNPVAADVVYRWRTGQLDNAGNSYDLIEMQNELRNIRKAIENQPQQVVGLEETLSGLVKLTVGTKKSNHINTTQRYS